MRIGVVTALLVLLMALGFLGELVGPPHVAADATVPIRVFAVQCDTDGDPSTVEEEYVVGPDPFPTVLDAILNCLVVNGHPVGIVFVVDPD